LVVEENEIISILDSLFK